MQSVLSTTEIRDFNRLFEPTPFNTGPPIPKLLPSGALPSTGPDFDLGAPDLSDSPASTVSTTLSLDDDEIRKIFSNPRYDPLPAINTAIASHRDVEHGYDPYTARAEQWTNMMGYESSSKEDLNPLAAPFVPSFVLHNPPMQSSLFFTGPGHPPHPSADCNYSYPQLFNTPDQFEDIPASSYPLAPPGLPPPAWAAPFDPNVDISDFAGPPRSQTPPAYLPVLLDALKPTCTSREREVLLKFIIHFVEQWDIVALVELADQITIAAFGSDNGNNAEETQNEEMFVCDAIRRRDCGVDEKQPSSVKREEKPHEVLAMVVEELYKQFFAIHGEETARAFVWDVRELVLRRFISCFDPARPESLNALSSTHQMISPTYIRSALALSRAIPSLYRRKLLMREHVSMCLSVLLKDLRSVEHLEALAFIVIGAGKGFWDPCPEFESVSPPLTPLGLPLKPIDDGVTMPHTEKTFDHTLTSIAIHAKAALNAHVGEFLKGLEDNIVQQGLDESSSLVNQRWGSGRFEERVEAVVDTVRRWERSLVANLVDSMGQARGQALQTRDAGEQSVLRAIAEA